MVGYTKKREEYRCQCGKLLFKGKLKAGIVEIKCRGCGRLTLFEVRDRSKSV